MMKTKLILHKRESLKHEGLTTQVYEVHSKKNIRWNEMRAGMCAVNKRARKRGRQ